mmetsp:Transcript_22589/g.40050  ORF Transcript_22589/g.40050 Transcript_22589/m.40050 type:complete len:512 (-) Transcript_22589:33-1568(-)
MDFGRRNGAASGGRFHLEPTKRVRVSALTLYSNPPSDAISLDEFEGLAVERLKVLSAVENSAGRGDAPERTVKKLEEAMKNTHLEVKSEEEKEQDNISHWVLRLAFAATEDLRRRFLSFEVFLFRYRFEKRLDMKEVQGFMQENGLGYKTIDTKEAQTHYEGLRDVYMANKPLRMKRQQAQGSSALQKPFDAVHHFKVAFTEVLDLVTKRTVYLAGGFAYVPENDLVSILISRFRSSLSQKLAVAFRALPYVKQEDRIRPILKMLETAYVGPEFGADQPSNCGQEIRADNLDQFARNMPLCMREAHAALKRDHHLKYHARLQFHLFLKGIGLSMQDCLKYFQFEFAKKPTPADVFQKKYAYSIRHSYGQEGKRADYKPYSCTKIIMGVQPAASDQHHGCPFKSYGPANLRRFLTHQLGAANRAAVDEMVALAEQKQFQLACRRHYEIAHPSGSSDFVGNHPNAWFEESVKYFTAQNADAGTTPSSQIDPTSATDPATSTKLPQPMETTPAT